MNTIKTHQQHVIGLDFGSDSVRALIVNAETGEEISSSVAYYPKWMKGLYCQPAKSQFRHHPQDYLDAMTHVVQEVLARVPQALACSIVGIGVDTTGSTPAPIDHNGTVLALLPEFDDNPNAMFVLWKDHTSVAKAELINALAHSGKFTDYTRYIGGVYSSEWFWAKAAWVSEEDQKIAEKAYSWVELCDWIPAILANTTHPSKMRRGICTAGHKAMWHESWGGLPEQAFLSAISPTFDGIRDRMFTEVFTADQTAGYLSQAWASKLGLTAGIAIAIGALDCHMGAVGAGAGANDLVKIIGTSTCDILMVEAEELGDRIIDGICGQVEGSAMPELIALEAGQSAFGDMYAWFKDVLIWPLRAYAERNPDFALTAEAIGADILPMLTQAVEQKNIDEYAPVAMDWLNGRRTPYANQRLKSAICDLNLGSTAPAIFAALVESTAHGAKAIVDCFIEHNLAIERVLAIGGIAQKSPYVMQLCADVIGREIIVVESDQCCALGAAIFAAVVAGVHHDTKAAQTVMASKICKTYVPDPQVQALRTKRYAAYHQLGKYMEQIAEFHRAQKRQDI